MRSASLLVLAAINIGSAFSLPSSRNLKTKTAYFQDDDPAGNNVIALHISDVDGTLSNPVRTATGGKGLANLFGPSQDSVVVSENFLFIANAGDDTMSMFVIDPAHPEHPSLVGKPAPTLGKTPVSVAYSPRLQTACVLNAGAVAGVTCYDVNAHKGLTPLGPLRPIPQTQNQDPTPPPGGPLIIGMDLKFNPSSTALFLTIRSNGANPGLLYAYPVVTTTTKTSTPVISTNYTLSSFPSLPFIFSLNFLSNSNTHLLATNPLPGAPGAAFLSVAYPSLKATLVKNITIPNVQNATCWAAYAPEHDTVYTLDALKTDITIIDPETGAVKGQIHYKEADLVVNGTTFSAGAKDSKVDGDYLYVLGDGLTPTVYVWKIGGARLLEQVQAFDISKVLGPIPFWIGMAIWPASGY